MGIIEKIEEIRQKPEHIRLRYVWALVAVSMIFVLAIWAVSFKSDYKAATVTNNLNTDEIVEKLDDGKKSLNDVTKGFKSMVDQNSQNQNVNSNQ